MDTNRSYRMQHSSSDEETLVFDGVTWSLQRRTMAKQPTAFLGRDEGSTRFHLGKNDKCWKIDFLSG